MVLPSPWRFGQLELQFPVVAGEVWLIDFELGGAVAAPAGGVLVDGETVEEDSAMFLGKWNNELTTSEPWKS